MECKRCGEKMTKTRTKEKTFIWECPKCGYSEKAGRQSKQYSDVYASLMGRPQKQ